MNWLWISIYHGAAMFWETLWALVFGFMISGVLQVFVSKEQMAKGFGKVNLRSMALATGLGAASSSCSYAAVAAARSAFQQGAALIVILAFMFASTNLVIELGLVLWLLMGWHFVLAEAIGALILIALIWILGKFLFPKDLEEEARQHTSALKEEGHHHAVGRDEDKWTQVANAFVMDWSMLWKEIAIGFLIAGFLATLVPADCWKTLFLNGGPPFLQLVENAIIGPLIAIASFVCSIGNIPLASVLWSGGISFGGVVSFIYADLIVIPLILIYRKYYGTRPTLFILLAMFISMVAAGILVDLLFSALHLVPVGPRPKNALSEAHFSWNYTTFLDLAAIGLAGWFVFLHMRQRTRDHEHLAQAHEHHRGHS
jgi:uncharacterized membrane protein YraQ (UPF0718 family)